jgi:hypothetical protein
MQVLADEQLWQENLTPGSCPVSLSPKQNASTILTVDMRPRMLLLSGILVKNCRLLLTYLTVSQNIMLPLSYNILQL